MPVVEEFFMTSKGKKILIADDDSNLVDMISDILQSHIDGIDIKTVNNGYEALITAGNFIPDFLILDIRMPKINGLEVCRRLRSNENIPSHLKILAMTAHTETYDRKTVLAAGADEYLFKPINMKTLLDTIDSFFL
ncbi:response regulator transcription factor [Candidatus Latescibacterota bacterium]